MSLEMMDTAEKKKAFPVLLYNRGGDINQTCIDVGISRATWRLWMREDEEFAEWCADTAESLLDLTEGKLMENIRKGNSKDIQFMLKTKGRSRGYGEKVEHEHSGVIAHAIGVKHYPPEPQTIEEWEKQVIDAQSNRASAIPEPTDIIDAEILDAPDADTEFTTA